MDRRIHHSSVRNRLFAAQSTRPLEITPHELSPPPSSSGLVATSWRCVDPKFISFAKTLQDCKLLPTDMLVRGAQGGAALQEQIEAVCIDQLPQRGDRYIGYCVVVVCCWSLCRAGRRQRNRRDPVQSRVG